MVIVGAGFGGIAAGVKLKQAGIHTFTIYESSPGIGGTWWDNTYPGVEVDVGSHLYSFSFRAHDWSRSHAKQPELQQYLEATVDERRADAAELIDFLGLGRYADAFIAELSTGTRRIVELAGAARASTPGCSASTSRPPASPSAKPRRSAR